ncbi:MAG: UDP-3-O-(3-hydroxymyristoyl)glucosamine N-acyltransferase [Planctomycetota bacterium]|nr:UDP-3-O-(3-hydroxymyristoyl)glucosamine N-acyltransferase [Planctomycetota bacterium]MCX8039045.1 UDP-3-O-(3-hydroxymyristoyl)glucosamine N-acyltransferase [Planctomycetota bacterium]MDW8372695.1 UDP-3-O-(3-hydroxymyristoyl)glucosamine N-acyltransferase [Planctomycetota bacterium]
MSAGWSITVGELAQLIGGRVVPAAGEDQATASARALRGLAGLHEAGPADLSFLTNPRYESQLASTRAGCVLIASERAPLPHAAQLVVPHPDATLAQLVARFAPPPAQPPLGIHPTAVIGERVRLGRGCRIGPYVVIGDDCELGDGCVLHAQVVLGEGVRLGPGCVLYPHASVRERCVLGARVIVHNGAVIGSDGFGYATVDGVHHKIPQIGTVVIEDDVEIGANTAIDRARFGRTRIGAGTKIDNLVQIAHNVEIGPHSIIVAQAGIAGSSKLGHHVTLAGQAGIAGHLRIGDRVTVTGQCGVTKDLPEGAVVRGSPAQDFKAQIAQEVAVRKLPGVLARLARLEQQIAGLLADKEPRS